MAATESEQNIIQMMDPALRQGSGHLQTRGCGLPGLFKSNQEKDIFLSETKQAGASRGLHRCFENFWENKSKFCPLGLPFLGRVAR